MKNTLDNYSKDFAKLLDRLYNLELDLEFLEDIYTEYESKINLAIKKDNIRLAKKALQKKLMAYSDFLELKNLVSHLYNCKYKIYMLLKSFEIEYSNIVFNYENNNEKELSLCIKNFSKIKNNLYKEFLKINDVPEFIPPEVNLDDEIKIYIE
ncbi:hypothetical protein [Clostridium sp. Ade.TY]|uniref:hypothetical protein n=1 Tax=Clostridium sp. Ade.TY TaxID=1391647 RepID=UPI001360B11E|nr:hypothetical protein [Clostridium sp. Ade.TY]